MAATKQMGKHKTKLVLRRLPIEYTPQQFQALIAPFAQHIDYVWFEHGQTRLPIDQSRQSVGYINVTQTSIIPQLVDHVIRDQSKSLPGVQVEFAPNQRTYRRGKKERRDKMEGTIDEDEDYKKFLSTFDSHSNDEKGTESESKENVKDVKEEKVNAAKPVQRIPIIDFMIERDKARGKSEKHAVEEKSASTSSQQGKRTQRNSSSRTTSRDDDRKGENQSAKKSNDKRQTPLPSSTAPIKPDVKPVIEPQPSAANSSQQSRTSSQRSRAPKRAGPGRPTEAWSVKAGGAPNPGPVSKPTITPVASSLPLATPSAVPAFSENTPRQSLPESSASNRGKRNRGGRTTVKTESASNTPVANQSRSVPPVSTNPSTNESKSSTSQRGGRGRSRRGGHQAFGKSADNAAG